jgi:hypothetical protein
MSLFSPKSLLTAHVLCLSLFASAAAAQTLVAPASLQYDGQDYVLAFKQVAPDGSAALYEYTASGETVNNWTRLVSLNFQKGIQPTPLQWATAMKQSLDASKPVPHYSVSIEKSFGYAQVIYVPDNRIPSYEANVHKAFTKDACGGVVVLQYAEKHPKGDDESAAGLRQTLSGIAAKSKQDLAYVSQYAWTPSCE